MNATFISILRNAGLVAGTCLLAAGLKAADADAIPVFSDNYIKFSAAGYNFNEGSKAAAQRRTQLPSMGAAGIEAFSYTKEVDKATNWTVDGKALGNSGDYLASFKLSKNEVGSFDVGYKRFRTFYDGLGGFFPTSNAFMPIFQRALYVDRGTFFLHGKVELPKAPVFQFSYTNATRSGRKDTTIWAETDNSGIPIYSLSSLNPVTAARKIVPGYVDLGERMQTLEGSVRQTFGATTASLSIVGTRINNLDTRTFDKYNGELKPFPAIPSNPPTLVPVALANNRQNGYDMQGVQEDGWNITLKADTVISDQLSTYAGVSYFRSTGDLTADRKVTGWLNTGAGVKSGVGLFTPGGRPPYSYTLSGETKVGIYTANLGVHYKPTKDLGMDAGVKAEDYDAIAKTRNKSYINNQITQATGVIVPITVAAPDSYSRNSEKVWTPEVSARYSGIRNVSLFGDWELRSSPGDERSTEGGLSVNTSAGTVGPSLGVSTDKVKERHANWKIGANWRPNQMFNARAEFFTKDHQNRFEGYGVSAGGTYILDYDIWGTKLSATVRPVAEWSFTTRYINQSGDAKVFEDNARGDSNDSKRQSFGETVSWIPSKLWFVQGDVNLVYDSIATAYPRSTGIARQVLQNSDNNYWSGSLLTGFVVDKVTNASLQATYYKANNYNPQIAAVALPYGAGAREYSISASVTRKLSDRWVGSAKLGYYEVKNDTTGGNTNFRGPLAYVSLERSL